AQRVRIVLHGQRRATRQADAGMIAGAGIGVDPETLRYDPLTVSNRLPKQRAHAALAVELALALGHYDFGTAVAGAERLAQHLERVAHVIGMGAPHPAHADTSHRVDDGIVALAACAGTARRGDILATSRGRVAVVDDDRQIVV